MRLLSAKGLAPGCAGFSKTETGPDGTWVWSLYGDCSVVLPASGTLYYTFVVPAPGTSVELRADGQLRRTLTSSRPWQEISGKIEGARTVEFRSDRWNGKPERFAPNDDRKLSLLFKLLRLVPGPARAPVIQSEKVCAYPFSRMEIFSPRFAPCCTWWLKEELFFEGNEGDPWNSGAARALRRSVLDGTYEFCKLDVCDAKLLPRDELGRAAEEFNLPIAPENLAALRAGLTEMPAGPGSLVVLADPRCNLACPSCRKGMIHELTAQEREHLAETDRQLERYRESVRILVLATNGEVFYSPFLRKKLKEATRERFPSLDYVEIVSNGILFDEKSFEQLRPGSESIRRVRISIDAGDADTYAAVRGGNWSRLQENLRWLASLRRAGRLDHLALNFVLRRRNFASLPAFLALAEELGADEAYVARALPWTGAGFDFAGEDLLRPGHPDLPAFRDLWSGLMKRDWSFRLTGNVAATVSAAFAAASATAEIR